MSAQYSFLPWSRQGLARFLSEPDPLDNSLTRAVSLPVKIQVNNSEQAGVSVTLYGPGEIVGLDAEQVIRTEPLDQTKDYIPNYFPAIDFDRPDLPWLFTPAAADSQDRIRPWMVLVVVERQSGVALEFNRQMVLPQLSLAAPAQLSKELPLLDHSWAWGHVQVSTSLEGTDLSQVAKDQPHNVSSRLICPRKLRPNRDYLACLVPAFKAGVEAGLGLPISSDQLEPAWDPHTLTSIRLPVYYHWDFSTGHKGDFESLAEQLKPRLVPDDVGRRAMDIGQAGFGLPTFDDTVAGRIVGLEGALQSTSSTRHPLSEDVRAPLHAAFRSILNAAPPIVSDEITGPLVRPPLYARWHAAQLAVPADTPRWFRELLSLIHI